MDVSGRQLSCLPQLPMNDFSVLVTKASGSIAFALFKKNIFKREIVLVKKKKILKNTSSPLVSSVPFPHFFFPEVEAVFILIFQCTLLVRTDAYINIRARIHVYICITAYF